MSKAKQKQCRRKGKEGARKKKSDKRLHPKKQLQKFHMIHGSHAHRVADAQLPHCHLLCQQHLWQPTPQQQHQQKQNKNTCPEHVWADLGLRLLSPPAAGMSPKSNQMAADKNVNMYELILDFVCCHHQQLESPQSQIKWQRIKTWTCMSWSWTSSAVTTSRWNVL